MHLAQVIQQVGFVGLGNRVDNIVFTDTRRLQLFKQKFGREFQLLSKLFNVHAILLAF